MSLGPDLEPFFDWMVSVQKDDPVLWAILTIVSVIVVVGFFGRAIWLVVVKEDKKEGNIS